MQFLLDTVDCVDEGLVDGLCRRQRRGVALLDILAAPLVKRGGDALDARGGVRRGGPPLVAADRDGLQVVRRGDEGGISRNVQSLKNTIDQEEKKKDKLLQYNVDGKISDDDFIKMYQKCEAEIKEAESSLAELTAEKDSMSETEKELKLIKSQLKQAVADIENNADISPAFVNKYIKRIIVTPVDKTTMKLDIQLFTGDYLEKLLVRSGNMRKKMIEAYENGMK